MKTIESINLIYRDPAVRGGRPCIVGTGLRVSDIIMRQRHDLMDAAALARRFELSMGQVYAALAYYHEHKDEIDADIREWEAFDRQLEEEGLVREETPILL